MCIRWEKWGERPTPYPLKFESDDVTLSFTKYLEISTCAFTVRIKYLHVGRQIDDAISKST